MKDSLRKCFKCGALACNVALYRFPKPGLTNSQRCELWAKYIFPDGPWASIEFQNKLFSEHRMLCHKHFKPSFFIDIATKKLHRYAYPDPSCDTSDKKCDTPFIHVSQNENDAYVSDQDCDTYFLDGSHKEPDAHASDEECDASCIDGNQKEHDGHDSDQENDIHLIKVTQEGRHANTSDQELVISLIDFKQKRPDGRIFGPECDTTVILDSPKKLDIHMETHDKNTIMADHEKKRKCFKCGSSPALDGVKLIRFPKPGPRNQLRRSLWAKYIFPERDHNSVALHKKLYDEHRMLCQRHFKDEDFKDDSKTKLLRSAVPSDASPTDVPSDASPTDVPSDASPTDVPSDASPTDVPSDASPTDVPSDASSTDVPSDPTMWYLNACRGCLTTEGKLEKVDTKFRRIFSTITELSFKEDDGFPQLLCVECYQYIRKALWFRRKTRRAYFVLKEIQSVKKVVSHDDILIVDRKKTNLISHLAVWNPQKTVTYSLQSDDVTDNETENVNSKCEGSKTGVESTTENSELENDQNIDDNDENFNNLRIGTALKTYGSKERCINKSLILVDIKPDNYKELEEMEANKRKREIDQAVQEINDEDRNDEADDEVDNSQDVVPEDLDMEDIFKGLKDDTSESDFELPEWDTFGSFHDIAKEVTPIREKKNKKSELEKVLTFMSKEKRSKVVKMLVLCEITYLSTEEQMKAHQWKQQCEPFKSSTSKCAICVSTFDSLPKLYKHVEYHNLQKAHPVICQVCRSKFPNNDACVQHCAETHWYMYRCGLCDQIHYSLDSLIACHDKPSSKDKLLKALLNSKERGKYYLEFDKKPLPQTKMKDTVELWTTPPGRKLIECKHLCRLCKIGFVEKSLWKYHQSLHKPAEERGLGQTHECETCHQVFLSTSSLGKHMIAWHSFSYACRRCRTVCWNRQQANNHYIQNHLPQQKTTEIELRKMNKQSRLYCNCCTYTTTRGWLSLYDHILATHAYLRLPSVAELNDASLHCSVCKIYFTCETAFYRHLIREKHDKNKLENVCAVCCASFASREQFAEHARTHPDADGSGTFPRPCCVCSELLENMIQLKKHMLQKHPPDAARPGRLCSLCGKMVLHIKHHMRAHEHQTSGGECPRCKFCEHKPRNALQYVFHTLASHSLRPYRCTVCAHRTQTRCEMRDHILKMHAPVRPYACKACCRQFSHLDFLNAHCIKVHGVDLKKTDKSVFLAIKNGGSMCVYPHMTIDGTLIDEHILKAIKIEICDYLDENRKEASYLDVFFKDPNVDPTKPTKFDYRKRLKRCNVDKEIEGRERRERSKKRRLEKSNRNLPTPKAEAADESEYIDNQMAVDENTTYDDNKENGSAIDFIVNGDCEIPENLLSIDDEHYTNDSNKVNINGIDFIVIESKGSVNKVEVQNCGVENYTHEETVVGGSMSNISDDYQDIEKTTENTLEGEIEENKDFPENTEDTFEGEIEEYKDSPENTENIIQEEIEENKDSPENTENTLEGENIKNEDTNAEEMLVETLDEECLETEDVQGHLIEQDGQYFVIIDDVLYKLENQ